MGSSKEEKRRHSIEEALHAVDAIVDNDNIIDDGGIEVGSTLLSTKSMLPTFNSKGSFTGYDKRKIKNEISYKLESSQYGFHYDKHKKKKRVDARDLDVANMSTEQSSKMEEFLTNPDSMAWEDLVASMKKEKKNKSRRKHRSKRRSSSKSNTRCLTPVDESSASECSYDLTGDSVLSGLPSVDEYDYDDAEDYGEEEEIDFINGDEENQQDNQYDDEDNDELEDIDFNFSYGVTKIDHLPKTRSCQDAAIQHPVYTNKYKKRRRKCTAFALLMLIAGLVVTVSYIYFPNGGVVEAIKYVIPPVGPDHPQELVPTCIRITTGKNNFNDGYLDIFVDEGNGAEEVTVDGIDYAQGEVVLDECYDRVEGVMVQNKNHDAWAGMIESSIDNGASYFPMKCSKNCSGRKGGSAEVLVVDGNKDGGDGLDPEPTLCLNGHKCILTSVATSSERKEEESVKGDKEE